MRFFHLSDLHIGKQLHHYNLKEEQKHILEEIVVYAKDIHPDAIVIAGDIYDKSIPSAEAVTIFDDFLTKLAAITPEIPVLIISGNHDSAERLQYAAGFLKKHQIYVAGNPPVTPGDYLQKTVLQDEHGSVNFYLLPFIKPSYVRNVSETAPESYTEAVEMLLQREEIDYNERNVLVSHQFFTRGNEAPETCDSERISVGGIDNVDISVISKFDYAALGHIHKSQKVGEEHIRYCGTMLKYSVSEAEHTKVLTMVEIGEKGTAPVITELSLHPLRDVKKKKGFLHEIMEQASERDRLDYVSITLTDEGELYRPKDQLEKYYEHILEIRIDNTRTRNQLLQDEETIEAESPFEAFENFFYEMQGRQMEEEEVLFMKHIFDEVKEGTGCGQSE